MPKAASANHSYIFLLVMNSLPLLASHLFLSDIARQYAMNILFNFALIGGILHADKKQNEGTTCLLKLEVSLLYEISCILNKGCFYWAFDSCLFCAII